MPIHHPHPFSSSSSSSSSSFTRLQVILLILLTAVLSSFLTFNLVHWRFGVVGSSKKQSSSSSAASSIISSTATSSVAAHEYLVVEKGKDDKEELGRYDAFPPVSISSSSSSRIVYAVMTTFRHHRSNVAAIRRTWGRHAHIAFFGSDREETPTDNREGYESSAPIRKFSLPPRAVGAQKVAASKRNKNNSSDIEEEDVSYLQQQQHGDRYLGFKALSMLIALGTEYPTKEFYVISDDDTFIIPYNLEKVVISKRHSSSGGVHSSSGGSDLFAGYTLTHIHPPIVGGGGGIILSQATMKKLLFNSKKGTHPCNPHHEAAVAPDLAGDVAIAKCMRKSNVEMTHLDGMNPFPVRYTVLQEERAGEGNKFNDISENRRGGHPVPPRNWCKKQMWLPAHIQCPPDGRRDPQISFHYLKPDDFDEYYWWAFKFR